MICSDVIAANGKDSKYTRDCQIRAISGLPYAEAAALVDHQGPPPIVIQAGIGTLILSPDHEEFTSAPTLGQKALGLLSAVASPSPATNEEASRRLAICQGCAFKAVGKDLCTACGCHLGLKARLAGQNCPKGLW